MADWQQARIAEFLKHTFMASADTARSYLECCDWNIFAALDNYRMDYAV